MSRKLSLTVVVLKEGLSMKRAIGILVGIGMLFLFQVAVAHAMTVVKAEIWQGTVQVSGNKAANSADIRWQDQVVTKSGPEGQFKFETRNLPIDGVGELTDGVSTIAVVFSGCTTQQVSTGGVLETGQTMSYDLNVAPF
jgi:hypothetical protein